MKIELNKQERNYLLSKMPMSWRLKSEPNRDKIEALIDKLLGDEQ